MGAGGQADLPAGGGPVERVAGAKNADGESWRPARGPPAARQRPRRLNWRIMQRAVSPTATSWLAAMAASTLTKRVGLNCSGVGRSSR